MPLDSFNATHDPFYDNIRGTHIRFVWFPQKCRITGKRLWLEDAYVQIAMYTGPGEPIFEYRWYDKDEFLISKIKGNL